MTRSLDPVRRLVAFALCVLGCGDSPSVPSAASPTPRSENAETSTGAQRTIDAADAAQVESWPGLRARLGACEPISVRILYAFGAAQLEPARQGSTCRLRISTRGELDESDDWQQRYECGVQVLELDWLPAQAGGVIPERPLDEELAGNPLCQSAPGV